jgi:hypothetical protein
VLNRRALLWAMSPLLVLLAIGLGTAWLLRPPQRIDLVEPPAKARQVYSPHVLSDPYFRQQQRANATRLERQCQDTGELCDQAAALRSWLESGN